MDSDEHLYKLKTFLENLRRHLDRLDKHIKQLRDILSENPEDERVKDAIDLSERSVRIVKTVIKIFEDSVRKKEKRPIDKRDDKELDKLLDTLEKILQTATKIIDDANKLLEYLRR
uniref:Designed protein DHD1:234_A n=1 Tax=synthetic construct TaxID=32630 RepID=UPI000F7D07A0|nr:Chain A, Designed protein DHD1:234_A [synthetic construct]